MALLGLLANAGCIKSLRHSHDLAKADQDLAKADYATAEADLIKAVHLKPHDAPTLRRLGQLYVGEGRDLFANSAFQEAVKWDPADVDSQLALGNVLYRLHQLADAHRVANDLLAKSPENAEAILLFVRSVRNGIEYKEARTKVDKALSRHPESAPLHQARAVSDFAARDFDDAFVEFTRAIRLDPKDPTIYSDRGELDLIAKHDLPDALADFKAAVDLSPARSPYRLQYAEVLGQSGRKDEIKQLLADWLKEAPHYLPAEVLELRQEFGEKRYADCITLAQRVLSDDPFNYEALGIRGEAKLAKGDTNGAIDDLRQAARIYGHSPTIKTTLAQAYARRGDLASSAGVLKQALVDQPDYLPAVMMLAQVELRQNQGAAAVELLKPLQKLKPTPSEVSMLLARAYVLQGDGKTARAIYGQMAADNPKDPRPEALMAAVDYLQRDKDATRSDLVEALRRNPDYAPVYQQLVGLDLQEGRADDARAQIERLKLRLPKSAFPWMLQSELDRSEKNAPAAEADLREAIRLEPKFDAAYINLARLYLLHRDTAKALDDLTTLAKNTDSRLAVDLIGEIHQNRGEVALAEDSYERVLKDHPDDLTATNNLAYLCAENPRQLERAAALARQARQLAPDNGNVADTAGWVEYRRHNYREALALFSEALERLPADASIHFHAGLADYMLGDEAAAKSQIGAALGRGDFERRPEAVRRLALLDFDPAAPAPAARADLERAAAADPGDPVAAVRMAALEAGAGNPAAAIRRLDANLDVNPGDGPIMLQLAELELSQPNGLSRASTLAERAHAIMSNDPRVDRTLGLLQYRNGDYARALVQLNLARRNLPGDAAVTAGLARDLFALGREEEAGAMAKSLPGPSTVGELLHGASSPATAEEEATVARGAAAADSADPLPAFVLALAKSARDPGAAQGSLEEIYTRAPNYLPVVYALGRLYAQAAGSDPSAYDFTAKAHRTWPDDALLGKYFGVAMYRRGEFTNAAPLLQTVRRTRADDAEVALYLGLTYSRLNSSASAKAELERALRLSLPDSEAADARAALSGLDEGAKPGADPALSSVPLN
ncbi:MAG TPA: tetratricopeptide repeat protein [Opitutaceae bacterium]